MIIIQAVSYTQMTVMDAYGIRENDFVLSYEMMIQKRTGGEDPKGDTEAISYLDC